MCGWKDVREEGRKEGRKETEKAESLSKFLSRSSLGIWNRSIAKDPVTLDQTWVNGAKKLNANSGAASSSVMSGAGISSFARE